VLAHWITADRPDIVSAVALHLKKVKHSFLDQHLLVYTCWEGS